MEISNLEERKKKIKVISQNIEEMNEKVKYFENESKRLNPNQIESKLEKLNIDLNGKLNALNIGTIVEYVNSLEFSDNYIYTHCDCCKRNCHDYCDCVFNSLGRCKAFNFGIFEDKKCGICGCLKEKHKIDKYHWIKKCVNINNVNDQKIKEEIEEREKKKKQYLEEKAKGKSNLDKKKNELNYIKNIIMEEQKKNIREQTEVEEKIKNAHNQITYIIIKLKQALEKIDDIAMNQRHLKNEDEFIDSLKDKVKEIGLKDEDQNKELQNMKVNIKIFKEKNKLKEEEIMNLNDDELAKKIGIAIPKTKKSN